MLPLNRIGKGIGATQCGKRSGAQDIIGSWDWIGTLLCDLLNPQTGAWYPLLEEHHR